MTMMVLWIVSTGWKLEILGARHACMESITCEIHLDIVVHNVRNIINHLREVTEEMIEIHKISIWHSLWELTLPSITTSYKLISLSEVEREVGIVWVASLAAWMALVWIRVTLLSAAMAY